MDAQKTRELILARVRDLVEDLLVNDRKEDQELPLGAIEASVADKIYGVGLWELPLEFERELRRLIPVPLPAEEEKK